MDGTIVKEFSDWAEKGMIYQKELLRLVDEDTDAFNKIMDAFGLPKKTDEEKASPKASNRKCNKEHIFLFRLKQWKQLLMPWK
ncbi:MAG: cyclodeaminase/cyclohydrolase family protein [Marinilabiliales bacterium]|nr:cyclodeaminase/cyclohydrolase family protein [Marinilabiliales bacterium]